MTERNKVKDDIPSGQLINVHNEHIAEHNMFWTILLSCQSYKFGTDLMSSFVTPIYRWQGTYWILWLFWYNLLLSAVELFHRHWPRCLRTERGTGRETKQDIEGGRILSLFVFNKTFYLSEVELTPSGLVDHRLSPRRLRTERGTDRETRRVFRKQFGYH